MKRVVIAHGWEERPRSIWFPWLRSALEESGYVVEIPEMPDTDNPRIGPWVDQLQNAVGSPDEDTYFITHSIGGQTVLRYLEKVDQKVGGALFVAGWFGLENLEDEESKELARPWLETPIDIEKVGQVLPKSALIISDNDPYGAFEENKKKFASFTSIEPVVMHDAGHIVQKEEPVILETFLKLIV